ncbi:hypothetical protein ACPWSR_14150 [Alloiococcus sp. CFN-8]|uniref:hypothetical protein n=1 Tax=Alloiococcus sp. CFN-8 TaxID=3416081 RepID=UPI003CF3B63B
MIEDKELRYIRILDNLCSYSKLTKEDLIRLMEDKDSKHLLFLFLKNHGYTDQEIISRLFNIKSKSSIKSNFKKAEERFFVNSTFREKYFEIEDKVKKII